MDQATYQRLRAELWSRVYADYANHSHRNPFVAPAKIADDAVFDFDGRFQPSKVQS